MITGKDLIEWGFTPGPWFKSAIVEANRLESEGALTLTIVKVLQTYAPPSIETIRRRDEGEMYFTNIDAENALEFENVRAVEAHMDELMRIPTIKAGAIMPDACPAGSAKGTIPGTSEYGTVGDGYDGLCPSCADKAENDE